MRHRTLVMWSVLICLLVRPSGPRAGEAELSVDAGAGPVDMGAGAPAALSDPGVQPWSRVTSARGCVPRYGEPQFLLRVAGEDTYDPEPTAADFTGDGLDDVIIRRFEFGTLRTFPLDVLVNDGNGSLFLGTSTVFAGAPPHVQSPVPPIVADFNGDGRPDLFVPDPGKDAPPFPGYQNTLVLSAPGGKLIDATANLPQQNTFTHSAAAGDIDGDGDNDLYLGNFWSQNLISPQILINDGSGRFSLGQNRLHPSLALDQNGYTGCEFADVDNDGSPDLVLGDAGDSIHNEYSTPDSVVFLNDGSGRFTGQPIALPSKPFGAVGLGLMIESIDLNHDGYVDLIFDYTQDGYHGWHIQVLINNGNGTFRDETSTRLPESGGDDYYIHRMELRDIDRDGDMDLVARPEYWQQPDPLVFLNDGSGHFTLEPIHFGLPYLHYAFVDLDGDGGHDLVYLTHWYAEDVFAIRALGCPIFLPLVQRSFSGG